MSPCKAGGPAAAACAPGRCEAGRNLSRSCCQLLPQRLHRQVRPPAAYSHQQALPGTPGVTDAAHRGDTMRQGPWSGRPADEGSGSDELTPEPEEDSDVPRGPKPEFVTQTPRRPRSQGQGRAGHPGGRHKGQAQLLAGAGAPRVRGLRSVPEMLRTKPWALGHQARCYPGEGAHLLQVTSVGSCFPLPASAERSPPPEGRRERAPTPPRASEGPGRPSCKVGLLCGPYAVGAAGSPRLRRRPFPSPSWLSKAEGWRCDSSPP